MSSSEDKNDPWVRKIALLKEMSVNPSGRIPDAAQQIGISRAAAYEYMREFANVYRVTEQKDEDNFLEKVIRYYNRRAPQDLPQDMYLTEKDVIPLRTIAYRLLPGEESETLNSAEQPNTSTLSSTNVPDLSSNAAILKTLLENTRNTQPIHIKKFLEVFNIMEPQWMMNPIELFEYLKYMFGPAAGENIFKAFNAARGAHVYTPPTQGGFNPLMGMMPGMNPMMMGGNPNDPQYQAMMASQMYEEMKAEKEKRRQDEQFDKMMRIMMMKMMGSSMNDKIPMNPFDPNNPVPYQVNEVMDETGTRVKSRTVTPNFSGQGGNSELMTMILKNSMDQNNMLMAKTMEGNKPIVDMLIGMFPHFRANSNPIELVGQLKQAFPEVFSKEQNGLSNSIEALRLKFDTEMAMQAQKMQLFEKQHTWEMEKLDKQEAGENAKGWMSMLGQLGEKLAAPVAQTVMSQFGGGLANRQQQAPLTPQQQQQLAMQQAAIQKAREEAEREEREQSAQFQPTTGTAQPDQKDFAIEYLKLQNQQLQTQLAQLHQATHPMQQVAAQVRAPPASQEEDLNFDNLSNKSLAELEQMQRDLEQDMNTSTKWSSAIEETIAEKKLSGETNASGIPRPQDDIYPDNDDDDDDMSLTGHSEVTPVAAAAVKRLEDEAED